MFKMRSCHLNAVRVSSAFSLLIVLTLMPLPMAYAQSNEPQTGQSVVKNISSAGVPAGFVLSTGSTIYSIKKFHDAETVISRNSQTIYANRHGLQAFDVDVENKIATTVKSGDLITVEYLLNQQESRKVILADLKGQLAEAEKAEKLSRAQIEQARAMARVAGKEMAKDEFHRAMDESIHMRHEIEDLKKSILKIENAERVQPMTANVLIDSSKTSLR